ncbi:hypothetical protein ACIOG7_10530 [Streptomyces sp. NPDC087894]|uniref:hypothetical protein n=1 Tax=Streptomyces sp. NPDC087894 TaxID=3365816 RepID=UPI003821FB18
MAEMTAARLAELQALPPDTEPAACWAALQEVLLDNEDLRRTVGELAEELARWTGALTT